MVLAIFPLAAGIAATKYGAYVVEPVSNISFCNAHLTLCPSWQWPPLDLCSFSGSGHKLFPKLCANELRHLVKVFGILYYRYILSL